MHQTIATAYRLAVLFSSLCRSPEAHSSVAPAAQDVPPASLLDAPQVLAQRVLLVLERDAPPASLPDVPPVLAQAVLLVSQQALGSQALVLDVLRAWPPVSAQVCWLQGVDALQVFQVARAERAPVVPVPASLLAQQPVFPLASPQACHSVARQDVSPELAPVSPLAPLLAAHLVVHQAAQQELAQVQA
jgi:hypothetical protein